jgi:hypothetical protein
MFEQESFHKYQLALLLLPRAKADNGASSGLPIPIELHRLVLAQVNNSLTITGLESGRRNSQGPLLVDIRD